MWAIRNSGAFSARNWFSNSHASQAHSLCIMVAVRLPRQARQWINMQSAEKGIVACRSQSRKENANAGQVRTSDASPRFAPLGRGEGDEMQTIRQVLRLMIPRHPTIES